jgi:hypothetical protein
VYIFVNNNTNFNFLKILSNYTIWDTLSQKTISNYCPFNSYLLGSTPHRPVPHPAPHSHLNRSPILF